MSFDTERDKPARLLEVARRYGMATERFRLATGPPESVRLLSRLLNTYYHQSSSGVFGHNIVVSIIDEDGSVRDDFFGTEWSVEELVDALAKVSR